MYFVNLDVRIKSTILNIKYWTHLNVCFILLYAAVQSLNRHHTYDQIRKIVMILMGKLGYCSSREYGIDKRANRL